MQEVINILIKRVEELLGNPFQKIEFTGDSKVDDLLNNLNGYPHAFVLACVMHRQIKAEKV